jgi:amidase
VFPLAASLDHVGPMARSAADCAAMLEIIAGPDPRDPTSLVAPQVLVTDADVQDLRVGVDLEILASVHPAVAGVVGKAVATLSGLGCEIVEVKLPALEPLARGWAVTCGVEAAIAHAEYFDKTPDDYGSVLRALIELGRSVPARAYADLHMERLAFAGAMARLHDEVDLIALPALPMPTPTLALLAQANNNPEIVGGMLRFTAAFDYSGQPSLTLPGGADEDGLPIGFQLIGPVLGDAEVLRAGIAYQQETDWHLRRPPEATAEIARPELEVS